MDMPTNNQEEQIASFVKNIKEILQFQVELFTKMNSFTLDMSTGIAKKRILVM